MTSLDDSTDHVCLLSSDNKSFQLSQNALDLSPFLKAAFENTNREKDDNQVPFPYTSRMLGWIVAYLDHHATNKPDTISRPIASTAMRHLVTDSWDVHFVENLGENKRPSTMQDLEDLAMTALSFSIEPLLDLAAAKIAACCHALPTLNARNVESMLRKRTGLSSSSVESVHEKLPDRVTWSVTGISKSTQKSSSLGSSSGSSPSSSTSSSASSSSSSSSSTSLADSSALMNEDSVDVTSFFAFD